MGELFKENKETIGIVIGIIILVFICFGGHKIYVNYQNDKAVETTKQVFANSKSRGVNEGYKNFEIHANAKNKTIKLIADQTEADLIKSQLQDYVSAHVSTLQRLFGTDEATSRNIAVTDDIQALCYAVSSSSSYIKDWEIDVKAYDNDKLITWYSYQNNKFMTTPEQKLEDYISDQQEVHDENAANITSSFLDAIAGNSDE